MSNCGIVSYLHEVEIKGLSLKCDSAIVMTLINDYIKDNLSDTPIQLIEMYRSRHNFDIGETLSQPNEYYNDRVIRVSFDLSTNHPSTFEFFEDGETIYKGNAWMR